MLPKYPKKKLKTSLKRTTKQFRVKSSKVDALIWMGYVLMMQKLATEAQLKAKEERKNVISAYHIRAVAKNVLKSCKA